MNRLHAGLPTIVKKYVWNIKYGLLGYPRFVAPEETVRYLSPRLSENSSVLDLGCGRGSLLRALRAAGWTGQYCGVEISRPAINDARKMADQRCSFTVSDFESFRSPFKWEIIAMIESLCYVKLGDVPTFLSRLMGMLKDDGALLVRLHDVQKYREYVDAMYRLYPHVMKVADNLFCITHPVRTSEHPKSDIRQAQAR